MTVPAFVACRGGKLRNRRPPFATDDGAAACRSAGAVQLQPEADARPGEPPWFGRPSFLLEAADTQYGMPHMERGVAPGRECPVVILVHREKSNLPVRTRLAAPQTGARELLSACPRSLSMGEHV